LLNTHHKKLLQTDVLECSQDFVMSLPFDDVKKWRRGNWIPLKQYVGPLRKHIANMEKSEITNVQLWRKNALTGTCIFCAQQEMSATCGAKSSTVIYIEATDMLKDFSGKRWVIDPLTMLSNIRSYRVVTLGDGATTKPQQSSVVGLPDSWPNPEEDRFRNIWWSAENALKHCLQGCLTNILHHMRAGNDALEFKRLSTLDNASLLRELEMESFPSKVVRGDGRKIDNFQKCKWLL